MLLLCFYTRSIVLPTGVGKTTLVQKACEALVSSGVGLEGFYTEEVREGGRRVGFDVVTLAGERGHLSRIRWRFYPQRPYQAARLFHLIVLILPRLILSCREGAGTSHGRREYTVGQYVVDLPSFESLALPLFRHVRLQHMACKLIF